MTSVPFGDVLEDTGSLPDDWSEGAEVSSRPIAEDDVRIIQMFNAALLSHFACATGKESSAIKDKERDYSRRVLTFTWGEWADTRHFLCSCADLDEAKVRKAAIAAIDKADREQGRERAIEPVKAMKPAPVKRWSATDFLAYALANAEGLEELGELDSAIDEAARREKIELRTKHAIAARMAQNVSAQTHSDQRYAFADVPAMAAE